MATSETLLASVRTLSRPDPGASGTRPGFGAAFGSSSSPPVAGAVAMTVANEGVDDLDTPTGLKFLVGLAFAGSGLYAWGRRPENRLGPLMTAVG